MFRRPGWAAVLVTVSLALITHTSGASVFYDLQRVASLGDFGSVYRDSSVTINRSGQMAFVGRSLDPGGVVIEHIYASDLDPLTFHDVMPGVTTLYSPRFSPGLQLNDQGWVLTRRLEVQPSLLGPITYTFLETWNVAAQNVKNVLQSAAPILTQFHGFYSHPTQNNLGEVVFQGIDANNANFLADMTNQGNFIAGLTGEIRRPRLADNMTFVLRGGAAPFTLTVRNYVFTSLATIASSPNFTYVGKSPGISDDGSIVVFYGELSATGATALGTTAGPGIFASVKEGGAFVPPVRVSGFQGAELGKRAGNPIRFTVVNGGTVTYNGYDIDSPVAVTDTVENSFVVAFVATPETYGAINPRSGVPYVFTAGKGLWTVRVDGRRPPSAQSPGGTGPIQYVPTSPQPVTQAGDIVAGTIVTDVAVYDPIALAPTDDQGSPRTMRRGDHRVALWLNTTAGPMVVRGSHLDSDQDGLLDSWETAGIDVDRDGTSDLNLAAMGAHPLHRDLFIELDWLPPCTNAVGVHRDFAPEPEALETLRQMFNNAPPDPVTHMGITLHIDAGLGRSVNMGAGPLQGGDYSIPA